MPLAIMNLDPEIIDQKTKYSFDVIIKISIFLKYYILFAFSCLF